MMTAKKSSSLRTDSFDQIALQDMEKVKLMNRLGVRHLYDQAVETLKTHVQSRNSAVLSYVN